jgi:hypothetical protein
LDYNLSVLNWSLMFHFNLNIKDVLLKRKIKIKMMEWGEKQTFFFFKVEERSKLNEGSGEKQACFSPSKHDRGKNIPVFSPLVSPPFFI